MLKYNIKNWPIAVWDWLFFIASPATFLTYPSIISISISFMPHMRGFHYYLCGERWHNFARGTETSLVSSFLETFTIWCSFSLLRFQIKKTFTFSKHHAHPSSITAPRASPLSFVSRTRNRPSLLRGAHRRKCECLLWDEKRERKKQSHQRQEVSMKSPNLSLQTVVSLVTLPALSLLLSVQTESPK